MTPSGTNGSFVDQKIVNQCLVGERLKAGNVTKTGNVASAPSAPAPTSSAALGQQLKAAAGGREGGSQSVVALAVGVLGVVFVMGM
jgi:hypothetical protein